MKTVVLTGLALGVMVVGCGGWAAWNATASANHAPGGGPLQIEVVAPREPDLPDRPILTVGELRDGYVHDPERLQSPPAILDAEYAYVEAAWPEPEPVAAPVDQPEGLVWTSLRPAAPPRLEPDDYSFGFDQSRREQPSEDALSFVDAGGSTTATIDTVPLDNRGLD